MTDEALLAVPSPMADLPAGTSFGTLVHAVLETTDPQAPDLLAELRVRSAEQLARRAAPLTPDQLAHALLPVLHTPLGPLAAGITLRDIPIRDRLAELDFEVPLAGGDESGGDESGGDGPTPASPWGSWHRSCAVTCARTIRWPATPTGSRHRGSPGCRCAGTSPAAWTRCCGYPDRATWSSTTRPTGWVRSAARRAIRQAGPRRPAPDSAAAAGGRSSAIPQGLSAWHYRPAALDAVMAESDYPLAGAAVLRCAASLPALAAARVRPGAAHRRGAVPVRARHVRARHAAGRRAAVRGVRLAAAGGAGHRVCRTCSTAPVDPSPPPGGAG